MNRKLNSIIWVKGLLMECPHGRAARNCPLRQLRGMPEREANKTIDEMSKEELNSCLCTHRECYARRMEEWGDPVC
jgi:hypothetical protein